MENVNYIEKNFENTYNYSTLSLAHPYTLQGGSYFTQFLENDKPLIIQIPECSTKQGIVKTDKKIYCDLMFKNNDNNSFIKWLEKFEAKCHELVYEKRNLWFQNEHGFDDIENAFTSPMRLYKSGEYILVRVYIPNTKLIKKQNTCMVYNENEKQLSLDDIKITNKIIPLVTIEGIRFSSRSFQIDIVLNQVMVLNELPDINTQCIIKKDNLEKIPFPILEKENQQHLENENIIMNIEESRNQSDEEDKIKEEKAEEKVEEEEKVKEEETVEEEKAEEKAEEEEKAKEEEKAEEKIEEEEKAKEEENGEINNIITLEKPLEKVEVLQEVNLEYNDTDSEMMHLKNPNEVYYEIYVTARKKAKLAKQQAVEAYLEAKNIKNKYMLENIEDSDDDDELFQNSEEEIEI